MHLFLPVLITSINLLETSHSLVKLVQNAAAQVLTSTRKTDHVSPVLASLHWLQFTIYSRFYPSEFITPFHPTGMLHSQNEGLTVVTRVKQTLLAKKIRLLAPPVRWQEHWQTANIVSS